MTFVNREVEHPGRYKLVNASTGEELGTFDLTREEGTIIAEGTPLTADNLNAEIQNQAAVIAEVKALRSYAGSKGIRIIGDVPIYVPLDCADVWAEPGLFQLDENRRPEVVAGSCRCQA